MGTRLGGDPPASGIAIPAALHDAATWGCPPGEQVIVHETHSSWVALVSDRAYKVKKPVVLPFLDYGAPERRRVACEQEVRLNRRLAPGLYLGVRSLVRIGDHLRLAAAGDPAAIEHVVEMRRFDPRDTLAARVCAGTVTAADARAIGERIASFHRSAPRVREADPGAERAALAETLDTLRDLGRPERGLGRALDALLEAREPELARRARQGCVREGHGDLRAEHVLLRDGGIEVADCVEFSAELRRVDCGADLAFLVMDLERLERPNLAAAVVAGYRDAGGDPGEDRLIALHAAARALVRAKVELIRIEQEGGPERASGPADRLVSVAERLTWRAYAPLLVAITGVAASGKSTLARAVGAASGFPMFDSDVVRKQLAGVPPSARLDASAYGAGHDRRVYRTLLQRGVMAAVRDGGAIVAATFRQSCDRRALVAAAHAADLGLLVLECRVPAAVLRDRAERRASAASDPSDASADVAMRQLREWAPLPEGLPHVEVDTLLSARDQREAVLSGLAAVLEPASSSTASLTRRTPQSPR